MVVFKRWCRLTGRMKSGMGGLRPYRARWSQFVVSYQRRGYVSLFRELVAHFFFFVGDDVLNPLSSRQLDHVSAHWLCVVRVERVRSSHPEHIDAGSGWGGVG